MKKRQKKKNYKKLMKFLHAAIRDTMNKHIYGSPDFVSFFPPYPLKKLGMHLVCVPEDENSDENKRNSQDLVEREGL